MSRYCPIDCDRHDYLEIACLRHAPIDVVLSDGSSLQGIPLTTQTRADKSEWLVIETSGIRRPVRLDRIVRLAMSGEWFEINPC